MKEQKKKKHGKSLENVEKVSILKDKLMLFFSFDNDVLEKKEKFNYYNIIIGKFDMI